MVKLTVPACGQRPLVSQSHHIVRRQAGIQLPAAGTFLPAVICAHIKTDRENAG